MLPNISFRIPIPILPYIRTSISYRMESLSKFHRKCLAPTVEPNRSFSVPCTSIVPNRQRFLSMKTKYLSYLLIRQQTTIWMPGFVSLRISNEPGTWQSFCGAASHTALLRVLPPFAREQRRPQARKQSTRSTGSLNGTDQFDCGRGARKLKLLKP